MSFSDRHAPESYTPDLAAELRDADRWITAQDAYYDTEPDASKADIPAGWRDPWQKDANKEPRRGD